MQDTATEKLNILHIDSCVESLKSVKQHLENFSLSYYQATTRESGLSLYYKYENKIDLVIIGFDSLSINTIEIERKIREKNLSVVLLILTSDRIEKTIDYFHDILIDLFIPREKFILNPASVIKTIAPRVQMHRVLLQSHQSYLHVQHIDNVTARATLDLYGNYTYVNATFAKIIEYSREELVGKNSRILKHPNRNSLIIEGLWRTLREGNEFHGTFQDLTKSGKTVYLQKNIYPIRGVNGNIVEYHLLAFDVTDTFILQEVMKNEYKALQTIVYSLPNIVCITDGSNLVAVNKNFCTYFNVDDLEAFRKDYNCVCELFMEDEKDLIRNTNEKNWISAIKENQIMGLPSKVKFNRGNEENYFNVIVENSENDLAKVLFVDITSEINHSDSKSVSFSNEGIEGHQNTLVLLLDMEGKIIDASQGLEYQTGYKLPDLVGWSVSILCGLNDNGESASIFLSLASKNGYAEKEQWLKRKDETLFFGEMSLTKVTGSLNNDSYFIFISRNLTTRMGMIAKLRDVSNRYSTMLERTMDGYVIVDGCGIILESNHRYCDMMGYNQNDLVMMNINDLSFHSECKDLLGKHHIPLFTIGWERFELEQKRKSGESIFFETTMILIEKDELKSDKNIFIMSFRDLSEAKKQEQMTLSSSRAAALGEMVGNIAHQWRQPLATISAIMTELDFYKELGKLTDDVQTEAFGRISSSINYLSNTIDDFRSFFHADKTITIVPLRETINLALSIVEQSFIKSGIGIIVQDESKGAHVSINVNELSQVLINILNNARDVFEERKIIAPEVKIIIGFKKKSGFIKIRDNAGGIDSLIITKIFDPYFTTKHQSQGTGLGLYMSKNIIEKHFNAILQVANVEDGAEFMITFPSKENIDLIGK